MARLILAAGLRPHIAARLAGAFFVALVVGLLAYSPTMAAESHAAVLPHKVAIHVDENDAGRMTMALNNAANIHSHYASLGESVVIEIVAYGPGLNMLRKDTSPVKDRIAMMALDMPEVTFSGCGNTHAAMSRKAGHEVAILDEARIVPSGAVRLLDLQREGYGYLRP